MSSRLLYVAVFIALASSANAEDNCRRLAFLDEMNGKSLKNHIIPRSFGRKSCDQCQMECLFEKQCVSYNCGKNTCDLNSSDHISHPSDLVDDQDKIYHATQNACNNGQCPPNATCLNGFTDKGYKCECPSGFTGDNCEKARIVHGGWSDWSSWSPCPRKCGKQAKRSRNRRCANPAPDNGGDECKGHKLSTKKCSRPPCSCKELRKAVPDSATVSKNYSLLTDNGMVSVYCHMTEIPGCGAGWTLAMKINGSKKTFNYNSPYWTSKTTYNEQGGSTGLDDQETKLPTYWSTPFTKICLGMKVGEETRYLLINQTASSLYSLIADGAYKNTSLGRDAWKSLINGSSLQLRCNKEGFNVGGISGRHERARIGIIGNQQEDCESCNSRIGFGTWGWKDGYVSNACGNYADERFGADNGGKNIKAMGYIFVQ